MPELPEVETVKRGIQILCNLQIKHVFRSDKNLRLNSAQNFDLLKNQKIIDIKRRARYLICEISNQNNLIIHLGMSGRLTIGDFNHKKHDHFACQFANDKWLVFNDARRFGFVDLVKNQDLQNHQFLKKLGVEPLDDDFNPDFLSKKLKNKAINIKTAIMNNEIVVGVGNIYASESLFDSKISPLKVANKLTKIEVENLVKSIKKTLTNAINKGGSTISDYVNASGTFGGYQSDFKVYGRNNQNCFSCTAKITRITQNGRSTFYCDNCQKF